MNPETEIKRLERARKRMESRLNRIDQELAHLRFLMKEERHCMARKCPLEDEEDFLNFPPD